MKRQKMLEPLLLGMLITAQDQGQNITMLIKKDTFSILHLSEEEKVLYSADLHDGETEKLQEIIDYINDILIWTAMTSELRKQAFEILQVVSFDLERTKEIEKSVSETFESDGVEYLVEGTLYNQYNRINSPSGDIETGEKDELVDFTFKGTIIGFRKSDDECVLNETELEFWAMTTTKCDTLADFFKVKKAMEEKGLVYVPSQTNPPKSGVNYILQSGYLFSTCSEHTYNQFNESDDE